MASELVVAVPVVVAVETEVVTAIPVNSQERQQETS